MGLRGGREHRARQPGRTESRSERAVARLRHRQHAARCTELVGVARGAQWMERERREARSGPAPLPGSWGRARPEADPRKRGGQERGKASARRGGRPERSRNAESMQEGAGGGRESSAQARRGGAGLGRPAPRGVSRWPGRGGGRGRAPFLSMQRAWRSASSRAWSPAAPSRGLQLPSLAWGVGVSYKGSCGSLEWGARRPLLI